MANQNLYSEASVRETLVAIEYLLKFSSEEKPAKASNIIKYAKEKYDIDINRQHLSNILKGLYENDFVSDSLGFRVGRVEFKSKSKVRDDRIKTSDVTYSYKYYISSRIMNDDDIINLGTSLKNNYNFSDEDIKYLLDIIVENNPYIQDKERVSKEIATSLDIKIKLNSISLNKLNILRKAKYDKSYVELKVRETKDHKVTIENESGYIFDIVSTPNRIMIYLIRPKFHDLFPINLRDIKKIVEVTDLGNFVPNLNDVYKNETYKSIEEEINDKGIVISNEVVDVTIKTRCYPLFKRDYEKFFHKELPDSALKHLEPQINKKGHRTRMDEVTFRADKKILFEFFKNPSVMEKVRGIKPKEIAGLVASYYMLLTSFTFYKD